MVYIYLTRHGETIWNKENRLQGWKNSDLTEHGIQNAIALGKRLAATSFQAIYTSPSGRAMQTANLIRSNRAIPIFQDEDLKELNFGDWEGKTSQEIEQEEHNKKEFYHFWNAPHLYNHEPHRGESLSSLKQRAKNVLKKIANSHSDGNVIIVSHAAFIKAILLNINDLPFEKFWDSPFIQGTSLTVIKTDGEAFHLEMLGDTEHMADLQ